MKRFTFLLLSAFLTFAVTSVTTESFGQAKGVTSFESETTGKTLDTLTNAVTKCQVAKVTNYWTSNNIQVSALKISGTPAGVARLYGSNDKLAWERLTVSGSLAATDSLNLANVSTYQTKSFAMTGKYLWYRSCITTSGTQATSFLTTIVGGR